MSWEKILRLLGEEPKPEPPLVGRPLQAELFFLGNLSQNSSGAAYNVGKDLGRFLVREKQRVGFIPGSVLFHYSLADSTFTHLDEGLRETYPNLPVRSNPVNWDSRVSHKPVDVADRINTGYSLVYVSNGFCSREAEREQIGTLLADEGYDVHAYTRIPKV
jgi:hypothetical protein